jgi:hypothetical protein
MSSSLNRAEVPELARLYERHRGLTRPVSESYAEAAAVCLNRHHMPPIALKVGTDERTTRDYYLEWPSPTARQKGAWANADDATRDGAYSVALGAAECHLGLVALLRASTRTGADYIVGPAGSEVNPQDGELDLETATRLEVSGIDRCDYESDLWYRVRKKVSQTQSPRLTSQAMAGVVAFNLGRVAFREP